MTSAQFIGYCLNQTSAITNIISTRIYHGMRPGSPSAASAIVPCINYFEMAGGNRASGFESVTYSINCRATTAATALKLARHVADLFHGTDSRGVYGDMNNFTVSKASLRQQQGLIPEVGDNLYNAPVDIFIVYPSSTVS